MTFELRTLARQKVRYNNTNDDHALVHQLSLDGAKVTPTSATIAIYAPGSTTADLAATAMTISGTLATYILDTSADTSTWTVQQGYRAELVYTYSSKTYDRHFLFDICKYLFVPTLVFDQLVQYDSGVRGMLHDSDEDFSPLIAACQSKVQIAIERKVLQKSKLLSEMVIDVSAVADALRDLILSRIWFNANDLDRYEEYKEDYAQSLAAALSTMQFDSDQDGEEDAEIGGLTEVLLER